MNTLRAIAFTVGTWAFLLLVLPCAAWVTWHHLRQSDIDAATGEGDGEQ